MNLAIRAVNGIIVLQKGKEMIRANCLAAALKLRRLRNRLKDPCEEAFR